MTIKELNDKIIYYPSLVSVGSCDLSDYEYEDSDFDEHRKFRCWHDEDWKITIGISYDRNTRECTSEHPYIGVNCDYSPIDPIECYFTEEDAQLALINRCKAVLESLDKADS